MSSGGNFIPLNLRLWRRIDRAAGDDACWPWLGSRDPDGYGNIGVDGKTAKAHRIAWALTHGAIPSGAHVLHRCDNPPCCNPSHLFLGTPATNSADKLAKGRGNHQRGSRHHDAKLTDRQIVEIRSMYDARVLSQGALARRYGVTQSNVSRIVRGLIWKEIRS